MGQLYSISLPHQLMWARERRLVQDTYARMAVPMFTKNIVNSFTHPKGSIKPAVTWLAQWFPSLKELVDDSNNNDDEKKKNAQALSIDVVCDRVSSYYGHKRYQR